MISSASKLASMAGATILKNGGNAVDAAIAAQLVLNVVEPHSSGIGGGGFLIYFDAKKKKAMFFDGRETSPSNANEELFLDKKGNTGSFFARPFFARPFFDCVKGGLSVGTPGLLKALETAHKQHGKLPWKKLFEPAIAAAKDGFKVNNRFQILSMIPYLKDFDETAEIYLDDNKQSRNVGDVIRNPKLAETFEIIANSNSDSFYNGKIAQDIVSAVQNSKINPGLLTLGDMQNYQARNGDLLCAKYRTKYKICTMPLPSGGVTLLQILGILENFDLHEIKPTSSDFIHLFAEAARLAYADRGKYVADISDVPIAQMLDKKYLKHRASLISQTRLMQTAEPGKFDIPHDLTNDISSVEPPSTTHISVIDKFGNAVSLTSSIEYFFGSALSVDGILLNNQLTDFSFVPEIDGKKVANRVGPNKRPRSSMSPTFIFDESGNLIMVVGSPGGPRIIQFVAKTIIGYLDFGLDIQQAIALPNFVFLNEVVELEKNRGIQDTTVEDLESMGHKTKKISLVSGIHAITIKRDSKGRVITINGGADPRKEGAAIGDNKKPAK